MSSSRSVIFENGVVRMLDQRLVPAECSYIQCNSVKEVAEAILTMTVRGAPAIGAAGAFAMAIAARSCPSDSDPSAFIAALGAAKTELDNARPTAVNLSWATGRIFDLAKLLADKGVSVSNIQRAVEEESLALAEDDVDVNRRLGTFGASLLPPTVRLLHHCNTGRLATVDIGTALGVIYMAKEQGKDVFVWVDETRPRLQGARLTAFELMRENIPMKLIVDGASGSLMRAGKVDAVVFGADRVAANGDVANKIGTYNLAVVARENNVPVYACVPTSSIDLTIHSGNDIVIEERESEEITHINGVPVAPAGVETWNPAFDVTPHLYLTAIITEEGVCYPPFSQSIVEAKQRAEERIKKTHADRLNHFLSSSS